MKLEISSVRNKNYYDELLGINSKYKSIIVNPNTIIKSSIDKSRKRLLYSLILLFIEIGVSILTKSYVAVFTLGFIVFSVILFSILYYSVQSNLKAYLKSSIKNVVTINEKGIALDKNDMVEVLLYWNSIKHIVINQYSITVLPNSQTSIIIAVPIKYKKDFLEALKKYNKEDLIVDNSKLY